MSDDPLEIVAEVVKALPASAVDRATETACVTFEKCLAPLTEITSGIGRLIKARFDGFEELEKVNAAAVLEQAKAKIEASGRPPIIEIQANVVIPTLENAALASEKSMQELWANLLAQQFTVGEIHPKIPRMLAEMSPEDAKTLAGFEERGLAMSVFRRVSQGQRDRSDSPVSRITAQIRRNSESESHAVIAALGLIRQYDGDWFVTPLGHSFLKAVSAPKAAEKSPANSRTPDTMANE